MGDKIQSRSEEYAHVFDNFIGVISALPCVLEQTAILVIAGDVFHNKGRFETEGAIIFFKWLNQLLSLLPILIIAGNHDFRQEDPSYIDTIDMLVTPYLTNFTKFPIHYLQHTDHYVWGNVGFGVCSVKDVLKARNTSGTLTDLPPFPDGHHFPDSVVHKIALFHGSIVPCHGPYPLSWFADYEYIMLGDYHKQIIKEEGKIWWGYPGSLVQQDDGEPLFGHGFLLWDLQHQHVTTHEIRNDYSTVNIVKNGDQVCVRFSSQQIIPILNAIDSIPSKAKLRLIGCLDVDAESITTTLAGRGIVPSQVKIIPNQLTHEPSDNSHSTEHLFEINDHSHWCTYVREKCPTLNVDEWINDPKLFLMNASAVLPSHIREKVLARNKLLQKYLDVYDSSLQATRASHQMQVHLVSMEWAYLMCFGSDNNISFDSGIVLLNAPNAMGKSSLIDVICISLYGEPTSSRHELSDIKMTAKIINDNKPVGKSAFTKITVKCNAQLFEIKRTFGVAASGIQQKQALYASVHELRDTPILIAEGGPLVNQWIHQRFGTLSEMLMSSFMCQFDNVSFFHLSSTEQKAILDKSMHLEIVADFQSIVEEAVKAHKVICNDLTAYICGMKERFGTFNATRTQEMLDALTVEFSENEANLQHTRSMLDSVRQSFNPTYQPFDDNNDNDDNDESIEEIEGSLDISALLSEKTIIITLAQKDGIDLQSQPECIENLRLVIDGIKSALSCFIQPPDTAAPRRKQIEHTSWLRTLDTWTTFCKTVPPHPVSVMHASQRLRDAIQVLRADIKKLKEHPINPECWACKQNHDNVTDKHAELTHTHQALSRLQRKSRRIGPVNDATLAIRTEYEVKVEAMTHQIQEWQLAEIEWIDQERMSNVVREHDALKQELQQLMETERVAILCADLHARWVTVQRKLRTYDRLHKQRHAQIQLHENEIAEYATLHQSIQSRIFTCTHELTQYAEHSAIEQKYIDIMSELKDRLMRLERLKDIFIGSKTSEGFKVDVYRRWVLPIIEKELNGFLNQIVNFKVVPTIVQNKLVWTVHDRGNVILLSHCSGFQRFIIGLAMRATLCKIGAAGHSLKLLVIDEGFTCCDSSNIQHAKLILDSLIHVGGYSSIILMSHLDAVRELSEKTIHIHRSGRSSYIRQLETA